MTNSAPRRIIIVGHGAAGLCAALSARETARERGMDVQVTVIERAPEAACGGGSRWSPSNIRMRTPQAMDADFVDAILAQSGGRAERAYFERLALEAPATARWLQDKGVEFHSPPYYLAKGPARIQPVGPIGAMFQALWRAAQSAGVAFRYACTLRRLRLESGRVVGVEVDPGEERLRADAVVLASGGFEGNAEMLREHFGPGGESLPPISPGSAYNDGTGIRAALDVGARRAGDWNGMHIEPVDARSQASAPVVLVYPYGIVVD
ncbi:MAG: FAD-dependent oxidoreductase, partial [Synechococcaceae cyanobacterium]|nr:FAD-dependent oxidoreductase [Synechococcaceae cyanobacterium]